MLTSSIKKIEEGLYAIESLPCMHCDETVTVLIDGPQIWAMNQGEPTHTVMPFATAGLRERFISGTCETCWTRIFGLDEED
jgi:hypothetical protein